jgi:hypothetical protein
VAGAAPDAPQAQAREADLTHTLQEEYQRLKSAIVDMQEENHRLVAAIRAVLPPQMAHPLGHYYSANPDRAEVEAHAERIWPSTLPTENPGIGLNADKQLELLEVVASYYPEQPRQFEKQDGYRYHFNYDNYSYGDALLLYGLLRNLRPKQVMEMGSGFSSAVTLDTNERFLGGQKCTCIDPDPQRLRLLLSEADFKSAEIIIKPIQSVPLSSFESLTANDILFIDGSHVSKVGSDVNHVMFEILPRLASGVYVHIHDIFYPFENPRVWIEQGRFWTETYVVRAFMMYNHDFEIAYFSDYMWRFHNERLRQLMPLVAKNRGGCLWLRRN